MTTRFKKLLALSLVSLLVAIQAPLVALADDQPAATTTPDTSQTTPVATTPDPSTPTTTTTTPPASSTDPTTPTTPPAGQKGPKTPPGPDANQYTYNAATGLWESAQYTWDPTTGQTTPKSDPGYYYDPTTGMWSTTTYQYHPETGTYLPVTTQTPTLPAGATVAPSSSDSTGSSSTADPAMTNAMAALLGSDGLSNSNTGPGSTNTVTAASIGNGFFDGFTKAVINNNLNSSATTGDANVTGNTTAGDATTGPASVIANLFNLLSSAWSWTNGGLGYFVQNLFGNQTGDLTLQPTETTTGGGGQLGALPDGSATNSGTGPNSTNTVDTGADGTLTVNNQSSGTINNNVNLASQSGAANVSGNTTAGNATSGDATTDLNIMNLINSAIGSGQSFLGVLNIFGDLNGDILFPAGFLDGALGSGSTATGTSPTASNTDTGPNSTNTVTDGSQNNATVTNNSTGTVNNNIQTTATSGSANVADNTTAGDATTGAANTQTDTFNLLNDNLVGDNAVLVFVNVLGNWFGAIMNLPGGNGTTSGLLTGNATLSNADTGPGSTNTVNSTDQNNATVTNDSTGTINNNINASATSGNAGVTDNTTGGNATSGNASVAANVANFMGSSLNLKKWFGVLVINVFGNWTGDVNQNTSAGDVTSAVATTTTPVVAVSAKTAKSGGTSGGQNGSGLSTNTSSLTTGAKTTSAGSGDVKVLGSQTTPTFLAAEKNPTTLLFLGAALLLMVAAALVGVDRKLGSKS